MSNIWKGQIVSDEFWKDNENPKKWGNPSEVPGWQKRYKVRILNEHPKSKEELPDNSLPLVEVLYPVTGGSGHASSFQSSNLRKGAFVVGLWDEEHQPIIFGTYANSDQTPLLFANPPEGYAPFSGLYDEHVPWYSIPGAGQDGQGNVYGSPNEATGFLGTNWESVSDLAIMKRIHKESPLKSTHKCAEGSGAIGGMQLAIIDMITEIEDIKKRTTSWYEGVQEWTDNDIKKAIEKASADISKDLKDIIEDIRQFMTAQVNDITKSLQSLVPPNERQKSQSAVETVLDLVNCLFDKVVNGLISMIVDMLLSIVDRFINAPLSAIETLGQTLIGNVFGFILGSIDKIMAPLEAIFGAAGLISSISGSLLSFLGEILGFLSCQNDSNCPEVTKWSMGGGNGTRTENFSSDINSVLDKVKEIGSQVAALGDPDTFSFNIDFSGAVADSIAQHNVGPITCGPPTVEFFGGGGGSGAKANAIVSATGEILGIDMVSFGSGYTKAPIAKIVDSCGRGQGAVLLPIVGSNQGGGFVNKEPVSINKDPNTEDNPSITFSGGEKEIITTSNTTFINSNSTIKAHWELTAPREVNLVVTGEGSARIRIDMEVDDDPDTYGTSYTDAFIQGTGIDFNFGNGKTDDFDKDIFTPGTYKFIITGLVEDIILQDDDKKIKLRDNDGNDANATFEITQIRQIKYLNQIQVPKTEVITTPLTVIGNLTPFEPTKILEDYDYPRDDRGLTSGNPCAATTNLSTIASYELYENHTWFTEKEANFYPKVNGQWAYHNYGGNAKLWSGENDFIETIVSLEGGSGYGLQVLVRLEATLGRAGNPNNTRYKIISIRNHGIGYQVGDTLSFPRIDDRPTKNMGDVFKITSLKSIESLNGSESVETESVEVLAGGGMISFSLYSNYNVIEPIGFYERELGEIAYHTWGGEAKAWGELDDTVVLEVRPVGGSGKDMLLSMRFSAYPGRSGNPHNTIYTILEITNPGTGYKVGDTLSVPDISFSTTPGFDLSEEAVFIGDTKALSEMGQIIKVDSVSAPVFEDRIIEQEIIPTDPSNITLNEISTGIGGSEKIVGGSDVVCPPNLIIDTFNDTCNKEIKDSDTLGITQVIVMQPGAGYLNFPDGSWGGSGRTWANPEDTIVQRIDGRWDIPYPPGVDLPENLTVCDKVYPPGTPPPSPTPEPTPTPTPEPTPTPTPEPTPEPPPTGEPTPTPEPPPEVLPPPPPPPEGTPDEPPIPPGEYPTMGSPVYDIVLYLCDVYIDTGGINYSPEDTIEITPDHGASAEPIFSNTGVLLGVNILDGGEGFIERPILTIKSSTGYNASMIPVFCIERIGDSATPPEPTNIIPVIDCVGTPLIGLGREPVVVQEDNTLPRTNNVEQMGDIPENVIEVIDCVGKHPFKDNT